MKMMTKRSRTILFYSFLFLFLLIAPASVLYSQGYRFDFQNLRVVQTGGIFVKAAPKQTKIFIDGKLAGKTDFLAGSALISDLLPKKYEIRIEKDGYNSWEKSLQVNEKEVTEIKSLILFPQNQDFSTVDKNVEDFWMAPDGKSIIIKNGEQDGWALEVYDITTSVKSALIRESDLSSKGANLVSLNFSQNPDEIILETSINEQARNFILDYGGVAQILTQGTTTVATTTPGNVISFQKVNNDVYFLDSSGTVFQADSSFSPKEKINEAPFPVKQETDYELKVFGNYYFIREGKTLYLFNPNSGYFEKFFTGLVDLKASPDSKAVAFFSDNEIWVMFLKDANSMPPRTAGEKMFLTRFSEKIGDIFWLNSDYLIFNVGDKIKISEIDDRDKINISDLGEFQDPKILWNQADSKLYILSSGTLMASQDLIP